MDVELTAKNININKHISSSIAIKISHSSHVWPGMKHSKVRSSDYVPSRAVYTL